MFPQEIILNAYKEIDKDQKNAKLYKLIIELLYGCALRVSELCNLNFGDINIHSKTVRILGKGNKVRIVPIGDKSIIVLNEYLSDKNLSSKDPLLMIKMIKGFIRGWCIQSLIAVWRRYAIWRKKARMS